MCEKQIGGIAFGLGGALGPCLGGYLFDLTGHYTQVFWIGIAATVLATAGVALAARGIHARRKELATEVMLGEECQGRRRLITEVFNSLKDCT